MSHLEALWNYYGDLVFYMDTEGWLDPQCVQCGRGKAGLDRGQWFYRTGPEDLPSNVPAGLRRKLGASRGDLLDRYILRLPTHCRDWYCDECRDTDHAKGVQALIERKAREAWLYGFR